MHHLVNRTAIQLLSQNHRIRDKMLHACTLRRHVHRQAGANCTDAKLYFWTVFQFFFYQNGTWTHPPTSKLFLDFWNFFNFAKPLTFHILNVYIDKTQPHQFKLTFKEALYRIQILCRRHPFWSYPAGLTIADPPRKQKQLNYRRVYAHSYCRVCPHHTKFYTGPAIP